MATQYQKLFYEITAIDELVAKEGRGYSPLEAAIVRLRFLEIEDYRRDWTESDYEHAGGKAHMNDRLRVLRTRVTMLGGNPL